MAIVKNTPPQDDKTLEKDVQDKTEKFNTEAEGAAKKSNEKTQAVEQYVHDKKKTDLNSEQNADYARGGGQYGRINNRDFSTTLRLARDADRYNNKPVQHMFSVGTRHTGGVKDMGIGYERPKIQTMETRAMDQSFQLDTNQKQLAQALQAAVNRKDLDAFIAAYQQMYHVELNRYQAEIAMRNFARTVETQQIINNNAKWFETEFNAQVAATLMEMNKENPQLSALIAQVLLGNPTPNQEEQFRQEYMQSAINRYIKQGIPPALATTYAQRELADMDNQVFASQKKQTKKHGNIINSYRDAKEYERKYQEAKS